MQSWDYNTPPLRELSDEHHNAADQGEDVFLSITEESFAGRDVSQLTRQRSRAPPGWQTIVIFLSFFAFVSICWLARGRQTQPGGLPRRIAGGEGDFDFPDLPASPELDALCAEAAGWNPVESEPGIPRQSPLMVQEFLEAVKPEQGAQAGPVTAPAPAATLHESDDAGDNGSSTSKRPAPSASGTENEHPGPSSKVAKSATLQLQPAPFPPVRGGLTATGSPGASSPGTWQHHTCSSLRSKEPAGCGQPSFSAAASRRVVEQPQAGPTLSYVFARLPALEKGTKPRDWMESWVLGPLQTSDVCQSLLKMRELLRMPTLSSAQFRLLMDTAEKLANYAYNKMTEPLGARNPYEAVRGMGMRFLLFNALHSAARVAGPDRPPWWDQVASAVSCVYNRPSQSLSGFVRRRIDFLSRLSAAVDQYKNFVAPEDEEVVSLLRILFLGPESSAAFRAAKWDPWRSDIT